MVRDVFGVIAVKTTPTPPPPLASLPPPSPISSVPDVFKDVDKR